MHPSSLLPPDTDSSPAPSPAYDASSIRVLRGLEAVRERPGMYIGDVDGPAGLHHLIKEILDNSVDEALAGHASVIDLYLHADGSCSVIDDGRGIPVDLHPEEGVSAAEVILTKLHAGGKFNRNAYKVAGGLHGVGAAAVNALSTRMEATIWRDGFEHFIAFEKGITVEPLRVVKADTRRGTKVQFWPDAAIFKEVREKGVSAFSGDIVQERSAQSAYLNAGLHIRFTDERDGRYVDLHYPDGLASYVEALDGEERDDETRLPSQPLRLHGEADAGIEVEVAFRWRAGADGERMRWFANGIPQADGGSHATGFRTALFNAFSAYAQRLGGKHAPFNGEDLRVGLTAVVSAKVPDAKFSSQTKEKLISSEVQPAVYAVVKTGLEDWIETHPMEARAILQQARAGAKAREDARAARERALKGTERHDIASLPGKLAECQSRDPRESEVFLVEGDSAGGSAKQARDRRTQAVLPLRGKILNVRRVDDARVRTSEQIGTIANALRCGIMKDFDIDRLRYHKIILMTDADVDGAHIRVLLLTFFFQYFPMLLERGHIYAAQPPLYRLTRGKSSLYLQDERALAQQLLQSTAQESLVEVQGLSLSGAPLEAWFEALLPVAEATGSLVAQGYPLALMDALSTTGAWKDLDLLPKAANLLQSDDAKWRVEGSKIYRLADGAEDAWDMESIQMLPAASRLMALEPWKLPHMGQVLNLQRAKGHYRVIGPASMVGLARQVGMEGAKLQRFKGLGEMNADQLWETTLDPQTRTLRRLTLPNASSAEEAFQRLMAEESKGRKDLLENIDLGSVNIDI